MTSKAIHPNQNQNLHHLRGRYPGVKCSPHIFRHLAAEAYLRHRPGAYDEFRHILGNRSAECTHRHYAVLEASAASERFDKLILKERSETKLLSLANRQSVASKKVRRNG